MNKQELLAQFASLATWVEGLRAQPDHLWLAPIAAGKWSTAEIIGHLIAWDRYVLEERLPQMKPGAALPGGNVSTEEINGQAANYARTQVGKEQLIAECQQVRKQLTACLEALSNDDFYGVFTINGKERDLAQYIKGLIDHDLHHRQQIEAFIHETSTGL
ncbi:DinB family protein [Brevibacillus migulae]|uniref:DinB family protein n=1 Tax=Brevibacillus migulae TaxID=1644114 RepID=UPI00106EA786|nr:DinB family protein [Brevibacillus migulae]